MRQFPAVRWMKPAKRGQPMSFSRRASPATFEAGCINCLDLSASGAGTVAGAAAGPRLTLKPEIERVEDSEGLRGELASNEFDGCCPSARGFRAVITVALLDAAMRRLPLTENAVKPPMTQTAPSPIASAFFARGVFRACQFWHRKKFRESSIPEIRPRCKSTPKPRKSETKRSHREDRRSRVGFTPQCRRKFIH